MTKTLTILDRSNPDHWSINNGFLWKIYGRPEVTEESAVAFRTAAGVIPESPESYKERSTAYYDNYYRPWSYRPLLSLVMVDSLRTRLIKAGCLKPDVDWAEPSSSYITDGDT